jgi:hypothetical protein
MVSAATAQAKVAGLTIDKHLVKATHDINVSEMSDDELQESIVQLNLEHYAELGLDPEQTTVADYLRAQIEQHEARKRREVEAPVYQRAPPPRPALPKPRSPVARDFRPNGNGAGI